MAVSSTLVFISFPQGSSLLLLSEWANWQKFRLLHYLWVRETVHSVVEREREGFLRIACGQQIKREKKEEEKTLLRNRFRLAEKRMSEQTFMLCTIFTRADSL